jgi:hypothetical protein
MRVVRPKPSPAVLLLVGSRRLRGLPVLVHEASRRVWGLRLRRTGAGTCDIALAHIAFRHCKSVGALIASFRSSIPSPPVPLFTLRRTPRGAQRKTRGRAVRYSFLVGLFHSLLHAGLSRRTAMAIYRQARTIPDQCAVVAYHSASPTDDLCTVASTVSAPKPATLFLDRKSSV